MANTKEYTQALLGLLPQGKAWQGKNLRALLGAWAEESAHVDSSMSGLLRESNPATAKEILPEWERLLAITPAKRASLAQRRQVVLARLTNGAVVNDTALANLALALGWRLEFTYFKPARSGTAKSGQRNYKAGMGEAVVEQAKPSTVSIVWRAFCSPAQPSNNSPPWENKPMGWCAFPSTALCVLPTMRCATQPPRLATCALYAALLAQQPRVF